MTRRGQTRTTGRATAVPAVVGLDCAIAVQKIALVCVGRIEVHRGGACAGDAEAVHQIRVAITRLRATASFFAPMTVDAEWRRLKPEIAWLNASLGAARDSDVMMEYVHRKRYRAWAVEMLGPDIDAVQMRDRRRLVRCLRSRRFQGLIAALSGWIEHGRWRLRWERNARHKPAEPLKAYSERELNRWRRRLIRKGRHLGAMNASRRHGLRIKVKRFRYMIEALTDTVPVFDRSDIRHVRKSAKKLQAVLGDLRDLRRFSKLRPSDGGDISMSAPPGYRRKRDKLLGAAIDAYRDLKQAGRC